MMTRWHLLARREPIEQEVYDSQGLLIVCDDHFDVVVMPVQLEPVKLKDGSIKLVPTFSVPWGARWGGNIVWWRMMPAAPGSWKKILEWKWWQFKLGELWKRRGDGK